MDGKRTRMSEAMFGRLLVSHPDVAALMRDMANYQGRRGALYRNPEPRALVRGW
jgi:hypothetical protein